MSVALPFLQMACCAAAGPQLPLPETPSDTNPPAPITAAVAPSPNLLESTVVAAPAASAGTSTGASNGRLRNGLDPRVDVEQLGESLAALAAARRAQQSHLLASGSRQPAYLPAPRSEVVRVAVVEQVRNARPSELAGRVPTVLAGIQDPLLAPRLSVRFEDLVLELPQLPVAMTAPVLAANKNATPPEQTAQASALAVSPNESGAASKPVRIASAEPVASDESDETAWEAVVVAAAASVQSGRSADAPSEATASPVRRLAASFGQESNSHRRLAIEARMMALDLPPNQDSVDSTSAQQREAGPHVLAFLFLLGAACWGVRAMPRQV